MSTLLALLGLNLALNFSNWWPTPAIVPDVRLAPELFWLWLLLLAWQHWRGRISARLVTWLSLAYWLLVVGRYVDVTAPALFGRPLNLYWDVPQIPRFVWVAAQKAPFWLSLLVVAAVLLGSWALFRALRRGIARVAQHAVPLALTHTRRSAFWALHAGLTALLLANYAGVQATWPLVAKPVIPTYWRQVQLMLTSLSPTRLEQALPPSTALHAALAKTSPPGALAALGGRDVYLIVLESYGAAVYDQPRAAAALAPARQRFAADLAAGGLQVVSAFLRAPTFGGASDLSHLSLLSGIDLTDPMRHDLLLTSQRPTLIGLFRQHGYQSFGFYPSLFWEWAESRFYGYDALVDAPALRYPGPALGPWRIPDQYSLARFEQLYPRPASAAPRFVFFPTITSHFPFNPVPPYQPDGQQLLSDAPFAAAEVAQAKTEPINWLDMLPAYVRTIDYSYRWLGGFLRQAASRRSQETLTILVGDHQPTANVSGEGASWDVPVHVIAADPALLRRFIARGFQPGLEPSRATAQLGGLHDFTALLLQVFAGDS